MDANEIRIRFWMEYPLESITDILVFCRQRVSFCPVFNSGTLVLSPSPKDQYPRKKAGNQLHALDNTEGCMEYSATSSTYKVKKNDYLHLSYVHLNKKHKADMMQ